jgi:predicted GIY-YIG superfamily endonuclease
MMPIDGCRFSFEELTQNILPQYFSRLEEAICNPLAAECLIGFKTTTRKALERTGKHRDFAGCYVFLDAGKPLYVGISRSVIKRLIQHLNYDSHYSASLVYRMACEEYPHEMKRDQAMKDDQFKKTFLSVKARLHKMAVAFIEIENDLEQYLFEVYAAMKLDTGKWNTFRTH